MEAAMIKRGIPVPKRLFPTPRVIEMKPVGHTQESTTVALNDEG